MAWALQEVFRPFTPDRPMKAASAPAARPNKPSSGSAQVIAWPLVPQPPAALSGHTIGTEAAEHQPPALAMEMACLRTAPGSGRWYGLAGTG